MGTKHNAIGKYLMGNLWLRKILISRYLSPSSEKSEKNEDKRVVESSRVGVGALRHVICPRMQQKNGKTSNPTDV